MFCDAEGRPNPDGDYSLINGKVILRDGRAVRMSAMFRDASPGPRSFFQDGRIQITDAQVTAFRDSPQGQEFLAYLRSSPSFGHPTSLELTSGAENTALRKHLANCLRAQTTDAAATTAAHLAMADAYNASHDFNDWRKV